ncbi:uncharacterized protein DNG_10213 [Cephalotrichum gorgonifer]|uniref:Uncharacterized protein n=1 Tax=Cephalotrichum gorgonifer TaxID=2041049 RepID=A0AAE8N8I2_9PEZI|nr:uncharacterized protein DNG_10213 [Cephalotrichum gorgonifer]
MSGVLGGAREHFEPVNDQLQDNELATTIPQSTPTANKRLSGGSPTRSPQGSPEFTPRHRRSSTLKLPIKISTDLSFARPSAPQRTRTNSFPPAASPEESPSKTQVSRDPRPPPTVDPPAHPDGTSSADTPPPSSKTGSPEKTAAPRPEVAPLFSGPSQGRQQQQRQQEEGSSRQAPTAPERPRQPTSRPVSPEVPRAAQPQREQIREESREPASASAPRGLQDRPPRGVDMSSPAKNPTTTGLAMDTAQMYAQGQAQGKQNGPLTNVPLPNLTGQPNGVIGNLLKGPVGPDGKLKDAALMVGIKLDLEAEVHLTARVRGDILVGLY